MFLAKISSRNAHICSSGRCIHKVAKVTWDYSLRLPCRHHLSPARPRPCAPRTSITPCPRRRDRTRLREHGRLRHKRRPPVQLARAGWGRPAVVSAALCRDVWAPRDDARAGAPFFPRVFAGRGRSRQKWEKGERGARARRQGEHSERRERPRGAATKAFGAHRRAREAAELPGGRRGPVFGGGALWRAFWFWEAFKLAPRSGERLGADCAAARCRWGPDRARLGDLCAGRWAHAGDVGVCWFVRAPVGHAVAWVSALVLVMAGRWFVAVIEAWGAVS